MTQHRFLGTGLFVTVAILLAPAVGHADLSPVNLALNGTPFESSTINYTSPYTAIDGVDGGNGGNEATMTDADFHSWWQVDLGAERHIGDVEVLQRTDCCQENIFPFAVVVADFPLIESDLTDADGSTYPGVTRIVVADAVQTKYFVPVHRTGRYVMIGLLREYTNLSLGEVKVFEEYNAAIKRLTAESKPNSSDAAFNAVDNNTDGTHEHYSTAVSLTSSTYPKPTWDLTLDNPTPVDTVDVWSTNTTCCSAVNPRPTFTLYASPVPLGAHPETTLPAGAKKLTGIVQGAPATVDVGMLAQYFRVQLDAVDTLSLAEVQVWPVARGSAGGFPTISSKAVASVDPFAGIDFSLTTAGNDITPKDVRTAVQTDPYYDLDLGGDRYLETVKLWGQTALSSSSSFSVWTSEFNKFPTGAAGTVDALRANQLNSGAIEFPTVGTAPSTTVSIAHRARYIRVIMQGASQQLGFNELEVFTPEGYVEGPLNGAVTSASTLFGKVNGYHSRPNENVDVYVFKPGANSGSGFLDNWSYLGSATSSPFPEITPNAIAPLYPWAMPNTASLPAGAWAPGGVLGLYAQAYVNGYIAPIVEPLRGLNQKFVFNASPNEEDLFSPHIRVLANDKSPDTNTTPPPYLSKPMGATVNTSYYNTFASGTYREFPATLAQFNSRYLYANDVSATYFNVGDLGIGRKMTCGQPRWTAGAAGSILGTACAVSNYAPAKPAGSTSKAPVVFGDANNTTELMHKNLPPFATVVMVKRFGNVGAMFGVYVPSTNPPTTDTNKTVLYQGPVFLDSTGANTAVPNNCMACHGGSAGSNPLDLSKPSMFLPFDPLSIGDGNLVANLFNYGYDWGHQEENFRKLNSFISNTGMANPSAGIADFVKGTYGGKVDTAGTKANRSYIPSGWTTSLAQKDAYNKVIKPYCRGCHIAQSGLDFVTASGMEGLRAAVLSDVCVTHTMPHSQVTMKKAWASPARGALLAYFGRDDLDQKTFTAEACKP